MNKHKFNTNRSLVGKKKTFEFPPTKDSSRGANKHRYHAKEPGIGVGIFLTDMLADKILLGKRIDSGLYGLPGGWLEFLENWEEAASRELREEVGLDYKRSRFFNIDTFNCINLEKNYHAISLIMFSEIQDNDKREIKNMEPNKCEKWCWVSIPKLRTMLNDLFYPLKDFLNKHPKMDDCSYLKALIKKPFGEIEEKKVKKKSWSSTLSNSPFISTLKDKENEDLFEDELKI